MTDERFVLTSEKIGKHWEILITDYQTDEPFDDVSYDATDNYQDTLDNMEDLCLLLNQIYKENEQLKRKNKFLKNQYERKDRQLHRTKKDIEKYTDYFMNELNWDCDRIIKEVFK